MTDQAISLPGLDAQNPLGFLAALGLLRVLDEHTRADVHHHPREGSKAEPRTAARRPWLSFGGEGDTTPRIGTHLTFDEIVEVVLQDANAQASNPVLNLAYTENGERVPPEDKRARRDLKPPPSLARELLDACATEQRRVADLAAAVFSELVQDNKGSTKPTAFHFTAGQQQFLDMVAGLRAGIVDSDVREALLGPWLNASKLPSLAWDSTITRLYALRASDPSTGKRDSVPAANWLGVQALSFFPVLAWRRRLVTTCVKGGWKDSVFTWPVWQGRLEVPTVASLLRMDLRSLTSSQRRAAGIVGVFSASIQRSDQGGYGSFSPADVVVPRAAERLR